MERERVIVSDVIIQGSRQVPSEFIKNQMKTHVGKEYVPETLQEDIRTLFSSRNFGNVYADAVKDGPTKVKIFVYIRDYPTTVEKVTYKGAHNLSNDDLETITSIRKGQPLNPLANKVACHASSSVTARTAVRMPPALCSRAAKRGTPRSFSTFSRDPRSGYATSISPATRS